MAYSSLDNQPRRSGAIAALGVQVALAILIVQGLSGRFGADEEAPPPVLVAFDQPTPQPPPDPPPSPKQTEPEPEPAGAPAAAKAKAAPREAPRPKVAITEPTPAATKAGSGSASESGSADLGGTGTGTGGTGSGPGGGGGGGGGAVSPPVRVAGGISDRDYPRSAAARGATGTVAISFRVRRDGRVDSCAVLRSSGDGALDSLTCSLVERRFVYRPARGPSGEPRDATERTTFTWGVRAR